MLSDDRGMVMRARALAATSPSLINIMRCFTLDVRYLELRDAANGPSLLIQSDTRILGSGSTADNYARIETLKPAPIQDKIWSSS